MNPNIQALLDLQVIDKQRLTHKRAREALLKKLLDAEKTWQAAAAAATSAQGEVDRVGALIRQYHTDVERCDKSVTDLRARQPEAKTNKEYMDLINGIESAKLEKVKRETSLKELQTRVDGLAAKAAEAVTKTNQLKELHDAVAVTAEAAKTPGAEEAALQQQYDDLRKTVEPAFLEHYERLIKANHKSPLLRVDPATRATPFGALLSHNLVEQIKAGKLVIDRATNGILYLG
jgi:predicted  nucleic acid-binding Zn-ribbon protein